MLSLQLDSDAAGRDEAALQKLQRTCLAKCGFFDFAEMVQTRKRPSRGERIRLHAVAGKMGGA
jgi:hypothetical protein